MPQHDLPGGLSGDLLPPPSPGDDSRKRAWVAPEVEELPRLTDLTLQTGSPVSGGGGSTGSIAF